MSLKKLLFTLLLLPSLSANAGLISDYSLDSETNIVTDSSNNLEWLQWSQTRGMSLDAALTQYASQGWELASGEQMARLFNTFGLSYGNFVWQDGESNRHDSPVNDKNEEAEYYNDLGELILDPEIIFVSLFGDTIGRDGWQYSGAQFGFGNDDNTYHWALVSDDWGYADPDGQSNSFSPGENYLQFNSRFNGVRRSDLGVAFVRSTESTEVPEPSALALFGLALAGMAVRRRKTNKTC